MIDFKWTGKKKQVCRVNGVIIGFVQEAKRVSYGNEYISWYIHSRFFEKPHGIPSQENLNKAKSIIEKQFTKWFNEVLNQSN